ncbi:MAG: penicillin-binding transpeptidase domain-containing protein, partial [Pseudomonadales bacterium]
RKAIYRSSNVFFYNIASRLTIQQLASFAAQMGIGQQLALDVADASSGLLPDPIWKQGARGEVWYPGDTVNMGIGQGDLLVTPLQLATMVTVIANRGVVVRPRMVLTSDRPLMEFDPPRPMPAVVGPSADDWERLVDAMQDVVHRGNKGFRENGTAWAYIGRDISYRMAGKSGTTQVVEIKQGQEYDEEELDEYNRKHAWFIAFAPADQPVIALAVLVENGGGGSSVAGPVAREVIDAYLLPQLDVAMTQSGHE